MKTIVKVAMLFASALMVFSSCLKEQTGLTIEDIPGTAKISGKLMINEGQAYQGGKFVELLKPAANYELIVKVHNNTLFKNAAPDTYTNYTVTTGEDGTFELVIPAVDAGVDCDVVGPAFLGKQTKLSATAINDGELLFEEVEGKYSFNKNLSSLRPGDVEVVNGVYSFNPTDADVVLDEYVDLAVAVGFGLPSSTTSKKEDYQTYNPTYKYNGEIVPAEGVDVIVKVTYGHDEDGNYKNQTVAYPGTTDSDGLLVISLPCTSKEAMKSATINVQARELLGAEDFTYYTLAQHNDDYTKNAQRSFDIPAETYTFAQSASDCKSRYNFDFFMPLVKVVMTVNQIDGTDEGIVTLYDDDKDNNASLEERNKSYYEDLKGNYASFWSVNKFEVELK